MVSMNVFGDLHIPNVIPWCLHVAALDEICDILLDEC